MDIEFDLAIHDKMPKFDQRILDGLVYAQLQNAKAVIDDRIYMAAENFPPEVEFVGSYVCSPQEAYRVMSNLPSRINRHQMVDIASNDVYMVKYIFKAFGEELRPRYMFLPNFRKGNRIRITGKEFTAMTVLVNPGFSVTSDYVFIRTTRAPVTFNRIIHTVIKDGETYHKYLAWSSLHFRGGRNDPSRESDSIRVGQVSTLISHYLFCKFGLDEAFNKYAGTNIIFKDAKEVTKEDRNKYAIYESRKIAPRAVRDKIDYTNRATKLAVLLPKDKVNELTEDMVISIFYVLDHFPEMDDIKELHGDWQWKVLLGYILWGDTLGSGKLVENIESHLKSLDDYIDLETRENLYYEEDLDIKDIYQLFAHIVEHIDELIEGRSDSVSNTIGKRLVATQYILKDLTERIFYCLFELNSNRGRKFDTGDYNQIFGRYFGVSTIMGLRNTSKKPFMASVTTPGDNMYYRGTSRLQMQERTGERTPGASRKVAVDDPANHMDDSWVDQGNIGMLPSAYPLAKSTINPTAKLDDRNRIVAREELIPVRKRIAKALGR